MRTLPLVVLMTIIFPTWTSRAEEQQAGTEAGQAVRAREAAAPADDELEKLRRAASLAVEEAARQEQQLPRLDTGTVFSSGNRSLQALNPELSVVGDAGGRLQMNDFDTASLGDDSRFYFRVLGLHFQANLDPFSFFKSAIEFHVGAVELGEAYATWTNLLPGLNLTLGKFRQQFGVVQRWHAHGLDQFDFPLAVTTLLGGEGLNQVGISLTWTAPALWADDQKLWLQVTNGMNEHLFSGQAFGVPVGLLRWTQYYELSASTYMELGLNGMLGTNNRRNITDDNGERVDEPWRTTTLAGVDLTISWSPLEAERYRHVTLRAEGYWVGKETAGGYLSASGGFAYLDVGLSEALAVGVRGDLTQPFTVDNDGDLDWQAVAYLTWWQSPWVRTRLQLAHLDRTGEPAQDVVILQVVFAAGPHKHDRY